jgi:phage-related protein
MIPDLGERVLSLDCWLKAQSAEQVYERLDRIRSWLNPLRGQQMLTFDNMPERFYLASYAGGGLNAEVVARQGRFTIDFVCPDPFSYALNPDAVVITSSSHQHNQRGTAPSEPLLRLQGLSTGAGAQQFKIAIDAQEFIYLGQLASGDWLEIDCLRKTILRLSGQTKANVLHFAAKPSFPQLAPGINTITITGSGGATWSRLEMNCRNRWL